MAQVLHAYTDARLALRCNGRGQSSLSRNISKPAACTVTFTFPPRGPLSVSAEALRLERTLKVLKRKELRWITPLLLVPSQ